MRQDRDGMDCSQFIKQEPLSPTKRTFSDATSPHPRGQDVPGEVGDLHDAMQNGKLLPLIKNELKYTILSRRFANGMGDIVIDEPVHSKPKRDLTKAELERKSRRREQNRRAATKCRHKKRGVEDTLISSFHEQQKRHEELYEQVQELGSEKARLEKILEDHSRVCAIALLRDAAFTPPPSAPPVPQYYDPTTGSLTSPSLYGNSDVFTFDVNKPCTVTSDTCHNPNIEMPNKWPQLPTDTRFQAIGEMPPAISPPAEHTSYGGEFSWAESFINLDLLREEMPVLRLDSDDLNNLGPPGP